MEEEEEYDSTWVESEEEPGRSPSPAGSPERPQTEDREKTWPEPNMWRRSLDHDKPRRRSKRAAMDLQRYRHYYPDLKENVEQSGNSNFMFYMNKICSQPNGYKIVDMLTKWKGKYEHLERNHSYIQWLFPLREPGMNWWAKELTIQEIKSFKLSSVAKERLIEAYKMMLDFYGIQLVNEETGEVKRAHHWKQRFHNLNQHMHNNLRITRILKCLGELGFEHYQTPLVKFFLVETLINKQLPQVKDSILDYFLYTIRNKSERRKLILFAKEHYQPLTDFVWGPPRGTEHRFSHICEEVKKEVVEQQSEESLDEDLLTKISDVPSEAGKEQALKTRQRCSHSSEESTNVIKDTDQGPEDLSVCATLDTDSSNDEKTSCEGKSPIPEDPEKPTECEDELVAKVSETISPPENCEARPREKPEDHLTLPATEVVVEASSEQGEKSKDNALSSGEPNLLTMEENKSTTEGHTTTNTAGLMEGVSVTKLAVTEDDKTATEASKIGNAAPGMMDEGTEPESNIREEGSLAKEDTTRNTGMTGQNTLAESLGHEELNKPVDESETQRFNKDEDKCGEAMEIQETRTIEEDHSEEDVEMEPSDN